VTFNEERGEKALDIMVQLSDIVGGAQVMSSFETGFQSGAQQPFYSGQLAMMVSGDWEIGSLKEYAPQLNFGVTGMPVPPGGRLVTSAGGYGCSIPVKAKVEPSWTYIEWMTCAKTSLSRAKATRKLPGNLLIADDPFFTEDPSLKVAVEVLSKHGHGFPETPWGRLMWNRINRDMRDEAIFHRKPVKQAVADAAADLTNYIDMYYAYGTTGT
jgi:ABC-type glycerol-3-phosphate transport system substrate-binding protein